MASFDSRAFTGEVPAYLPTDSCVCQTVVDIDWSRAVSIAVGNVVRLLELPPSVRVVDYTLLTDDIDTGTTAAAGFGELNAAGTALGVTYESFSTVLQGGGVARSTSRVPALTGNTDNTRTLALVFTGAAAGTLVGRKAKLLLSLEG